MRHLQVFIVRNNDYNKLRLNRAQIIEQIPGNKKIF